MSDALAHLAVVELCDELPGAYCARQFAAWGAAVTVLEQSGGSPLRRLPPCVFDAGGVERSLVWEYVAAGKRSCLCDPSDGAALRHLIEQADVFVTDWSPARLVAAGLDYETLAPRAPGLIALSLTPFGADGPYAGFAASDLVIQALSGMLSLSGYPDRAPLKLPANIIPYACGVGAFVAALAALHGRGSSGRGQLVEVACLEAVASLVLFLRAQYLGEPFPRRSGVGTIMLACRDGYVLCSPAVENVWNALLTTLAIEPDAVPETLRTMPGRYADLAAVRDFLAPFTRGRAAHDLFDALGTLHVVCGLLQTPVELLQNKHLAARGFFRPMDHARLGPLRFPGPAGHLSGTPMAAPVPAPELDCGDEGGGEAARPAARGPHQSMTVEARRSPLADVRVLDLTGAWIGPYAAMLLADLGAEVIKVESHKRPDVWRIFRPAQSGRPELPPGARPRSHPRNTSFYFNSVNLNKRGLALDLTTAEGRAIFLELVAKADVVMENFTPRVMENFGLAYSVLRDVRPDLIMASFSGYGADGPYRDYKANGATIEAVSGWTALFGYRGDPPMSFGEMEADPLSGLQMAAHTLVALEYRGRGGQGQRIDGSMFEAAAGYVGDELLLAQRSDGPPCRLGNRDRVAAPQGVYRCASPRGAGGRTSESVANLAGRGNGGSAPGSVADRGSGQGPERPSETSDEWIAISVRHDADWSALLSVAAREAPSLLNADFAMTGGRREHADELDAALEQWTAGENAHELMLRLQGAAVPAGVALKTDAVPNDPHFVSRRWFRPLEHPDLGTHLYNGHPWRFSRSELVSRLPSPRVGEHSAEVLSNVLGLPAGVYERLVATGVTGSLLDWPDADETGGA